MKKTFLISILTLLTGVAVGYSIPTFFFPYPKTVTESIQPQIEEHNVMEDNLMKQVRELESENEYLKSHLVEPISEELKQTETRELKRQWLNDILNRENTGFGRGSNRTIRRLSKRLNLTPDQFIQLELLMNKRNRQSKIHMMEVLGMVNENDHASLFAEMKDFVFDETLKGILTEQQQMIYKERQNQQQNQGLEIFAMTLSNRYGFNNTAQYSPESQTAIKDVIKQAIDRKTKIEVPDAIRDLELANQEKRVLAIAYRDLDPELFEKIYESIIEERKSR